MAASSRTRTHATAVQYSHSRSRPQCRKCMPTESTPAAEAVYVVDDDASMRVALDRMFRSAGFAVKTFDSPTAFLSHDHDAAPCCAVLDLRMPALDGLALQARLREAGRMLPVVFITGHGDVPTSVRAMKSGA